MVNVFRFNIFLVFAAVFVNLALAKQDAPLEVLIGAYLIALAEVTAGVIKMAFGNSKRKRQRRYTG